MSGPLLAGLVGFGSVALIAGFFLFLRWLHRLTNPCPPIVTLRPKSERSDEFSTAHESPDCDPRFRERIRVVRALRDAGQP